MALPHVKKDSYNLLTLASEAALINQPANGDTASCLKKMAGEGSLPFVKMQACGNDFVVVSEADLHEAGMGGLLAPSGSKGLTLAARALCDRHFGIGADGLIVQTADLNRQCELGWVYLNCDGSVSSMCGNGLRCLARWALDRKLVDRRSFTIAAGGRVVTVELNDDQEIIVDLGCPDLERQLIPVGGDKPGAVVNELLGVAGRQIEVTCVGMGNPHCVVFEAAVPKAEREAIAVELQRCSFFPQGVNVEFVSLVDRTQAEVEVFERGCGRTLACASGAAAVVVAAVLAGIAERSVLVSLPGGSLHVDWSVQDGHVRLSGPARAVYTGVVDLKDLLSGYRRR